MMRSAAPPAPCPALRRGLVCLLLIGGSGLFYLLGSRFLAEYHRFRAETLIRKDYLGLAEARLHRAAAHQPGDSRIHQALGELYFQLVDRANTPARAIAALHQARDAFLTALRHNPHQAAVYYRLGLIAARLESRPDPDPASPETRSPLQPARFYFQEAVRRRPNGLLYSYALLHDLARHGDTLAMLPRVRDLVAAYPPIYAGLRKKAFWSPAVEAAALEGLLTAIEKNRFPRQAYHYLSQAAAENRQWHQAIAFYRQGLDAAPDRNSAGSYLHLGKLCLAGGDMQTAAEQFVTALSLSPRPEATLAQIYRIYKASEIPEAFGPFFLDHRDRFFFTDSADILYARYLTEFQHYDQARDILESINRETPRAEAYYQLARIAQLEQDWDRMELAIQKATLYDPRNPHYRRVFAGVLRRQKKVERAAREAALAEELRR